MRIHKTRGRGWWVVYIVLEKARRFPLQLPVFFCICAEVLLVRLDLGIEVLERLNLCVVFLLLVRLGETPSLQKGEIDLNRFAFDVLRRVLG